jgi:cytochrome P450
MMSDDNASIATVRKNALIFILSGVETLPGYVCSVLYYLLEKPELFDTAANEIRTAFASAEDVTVAASQKLPFLKACMREALRVSPPAVGTLPRRIPRGGAVICGQFVPGNATVGIHNWSVTHTGRFYKDPDQFRPERWLGDAEFASGKGEFFHPFGLGPRTCVARQ